MRLLTISRFTHIFNCSLARLCGVALFLLSSGSTAEPLRVSVASNFADTMRDLINHYVAAGGARPELVIGSSGKLYAQIVQGAPFDLFFSADVARPKALEDAGLTVAGSRRSYALGQLVLWPAAENAEPQLRSFRYRRFAIANPRLAPYGRAAMAVLEKLVVVPAGRSQLVFGENIAQAYQFVYSGNADAGLVAQSQMQPGDDYWIIPSDWYPAIEQQAVILQNSRELAAAKEFMAFIDSDAAAAVIVAAGYRQPTGQ